MVRMRTFVAVAALSIIAAATPALADHGNWTGGGGGGHVGGGGHGGGWHGGAAWRGGGGWHGGTAWHGRGGWNGGWRGRGGYGGGFGIGAYFGPGWGYPYGVDPYAYSGYYPYPYPYPPAVAPAGPPQGSQYYCQSAGAYYPSVQTCPEPWVQTP